MELNGLDSTCDLISRAVAKDDSVQTFKANIIGNAKCASHTECDAIIMDNAKISASPEIVANDLDAALIHEAAIGRIAGEQLIKLMTLDLTELSQQKMDLPPGKLSCGDVKGLLNSGDE